MTEYIPVCKPLLPVAAKLQFYLEKIDENRYYSNLGPLTVKFEERLADHFGVTTDKVATSANGTLALVQLLKSFNVRSGTFCVMPSWTFTATPAAAMLAGLVPYFIDVDQEQWGICPEDVIPLLKKHEISAVIPVAPFGAPIDIPAWEQFHVTTGIPVIIDAAAGFDSFSSTHRVSNATIPFMVSLHATKVIGIGEGAVVVTGNADLAKKIRMNGNFGFHLIRESLVPGINAKLSEYASAIGLAALDEWSVKRKAWEQLSYQFETQIKRNSFINSAPLFNKGWVSCYGLIKLKSPCTAERVKAELAKYNIGALSWYGKGCHAQEAYRQCPRDDLSVTDNLANHVLGLPFWLDLTETHLTVVFDSLEKVIVSLTASKEYE